MAFAALLALGILAAGPSDPPPPPRAGPRAVAAAVSGAGSDDDDDIPAGAPRDDYGLVAWCYGALDEYLAIYDVVKPDLKAIDALFGTPVKEDEPYTADVAAERVALKRFADSMALAERASPAPIAARGAAGIRSGRAIWSLARAQPRRRLADAWLFWGIPRRCEAAAQALKTSSAKAARRAAPSAVELAAPPSAPPAGLPSRVGASVVGDP